MGKAFVCFVAVEVVKFGHAIAQVLKRKLSEPEGGRLLERVLPSPALVYYCIHSGLYTAYIQVLYIVYKNAGVRGSVTVPGLATNQGHRLPEHCTGSHFLERGSQTKSKQG
jgi:hypothetical protein